ncbi:carbon-nitrogen hydrolase family protein [Cryomorphaceae bacterium]|nr:carbon-nitrogen hydrolase family protein [Cryomorphaceae bacterium]
MRIATAQIQPAPGDIARNIEQHVSWVERATSEEVQFLLFPELSLTGYEPELADALVLRADDPRLQIFSQLSTSGGLTVALSAPLRTKEGVQIALFIFQPGQEPITYAKQLLFKDEVPYFVPGDHQVMLDLQGRKLAPAICYESMQPSHNTKALELGAELYLASTAKTQEDIERSYAYFPKMAKKLNLQVLMANCIGPMADFIGAGQSAYWNAQGELQAQLSAEEEGLLIVEAF